MTELHLIIKDRPLCAAIMEQLKPGSAGDLRLIEAPALTPAYAGDPSALVIDEPQADGRLLGQIGAARAPGKKIKLFLLGEAKDEFVAGIGSAFDVESFAKPVRLGHLLARLQVHFQTARHANNPVVFGSYRLEPAQRQVITESGAAIRLTEKETQLLEYLGRSAQPVAREELLAAIWGYDAGIDTHTLETHMYRLRRKLDPDGRDPAMLIVQQGAYSLAARREE